MKIKKKAGLKDSPAWKKFDAECDRLNYLSGRHDELVEQVARQPWMENWVAGEVERGIVEMETLMKSISNFTGIPF